VTQVGGFCITPRKGQRLATLSLPYNFPSSTHHAPHSLIGPSPYCTVAIGSFSSVTGIRGGPIALFDETAGEQAKEIDGLLLQLLSKSLPQFWTGTPSYINL